MNRALFWLLLPVSLVAIAILGTIFLVVLAVMPPVVSTVAFVILGMAGLWFLLRRRGGGRVVSEGSLLGRQKSKEGLL